MRKKIRMKAMLCAFALTGISTLAAPMVSAQELDSEIGVTAVNTPDAETRAYIREWRYKVIGNHLYKRLYNASTGQWESDWILVQ